MAWQLTEDLETFLTAAGGFLRARPAANTIMLTAAETLRAKGPAAFGDAAPLFGWRAGPGGTIGAALLHTPPYPVVLTGRNRPAAGQARIGPVYTPPGLRGRGFGGAAAVSAARPRPRSPRPPWTTAPRAWCCSPTWTTPQATPCTSASATARSATGQCSASALPSRDDHGVLVAPAKTP